MVFSSVSKNKANRLCVFRYFRHTAGRPGFRLEFSPGKLCRSATGQRLGSHNNVASKAALFV